MTTTMRTLVKRLVAHQAVKSGRLTLHTPITGLEGTIATSLPFHVQEARPIFYFVELLRGVKRILEHMVMYHNTCCTLCSIQRVSSPFSFIHLFPRVVDTETCISIVLATRAPQKH